MKSSCNIFQEDSKASHEPEKSYRKIKNANALLYASVWTIFKLPSLLVKIKKQNPTNNEPIKIKKPTTNDYGLPCDLL